MTMRITTVNSIYEVDQENKKIRRLLGKNAPTSRQGNDGQWKDYHLIEIMGGGEIFHHPGTVDYVIACGRELFIGWDDEGRGTMTSPIVAIEEVHDEASVGLP